MPTHAPALPPRFLVFSRLGYLLDFVVYGALCLALATVLVVTSPLSDSLRLISWLVLGAFMWCCLEYLLHRFVLHGLPPFKHWHAQHHAQPRALMGIPTWASFVLFSIGAAVPAWALLPQDAALALMLGLLLGYVAYIGTHHRLHHPGRLDFAWQRRALRWHARHHGSADGRRQLGHFGVTSSLWDQILGTGGRASRRATPPLTAAGPAPSPAPPPGG
jgi:sterol desaturase/sphingolipid hydroxylase (fatty acid hydroxylase superfamily)